MRTLLLMRHAEAVAGVRDRERPLTPRGLLQAQSVGCQIAALGLSPQHILCSGILRAQETSKAVLLALSPALPASPCVENAGDRFYMASRPDDLLDMARFSLNDDAETALMIGHNPSVYEFALHLASHNAHPFFSLLCAGYAPATLSVFAFSGVSWPDLSPQTCTLTHVISANPG